MLMILVPNVGESTYSVNYDPKLGRNILLDMLLCWGKLQTPFKKPKMLNITVWIAKKFQL